MATASVIFTYVDNIVEGIAALPVFLRACRSSLSGMQCFTTNGKWAMKYDEIYKELYYRKPVDVALCPYHVSSLGVHIDHR